MLVSQFIFHPKEVLSYFIFSGGWSQAQFGSGGQKSKACAPLEVHYGVQEPKNPWVSAQNGSRVGVFRRQTVPDPKMLKLDVSYEIIL